MPVRDVTRNNRLGFYNPVRQFQSQSDTGCTMWRRILTKNPKVGLRVLRLGLSAIIVVAPYAARSAEIGRVQARMEHGYPVLSWPNSPGDVYVVEATTNVAASIWQRRATLTTEAQDHSWADDAATGQGTFYRVALATNVTVFQTLQQALRRACINQGIVGASAAVVFPRDGLWLGTYGSSDGTAPVRPDTPFEVGSVTKTLVAATILRLAEEGRLSLEDTVGRWLPGLSSPNVSSAITIRQMLNHRAGTYNFGDDPEFRQALFADWSRRWQPEEVLNYVKAPYFAPDADGQYSNTGYVMLGMIIRSVTGSTVAEEMHRTVLNRAGLRRTFMGAEESWHGLLAAPHLDFDGDGVHENLGDRSQNAILTSFWTSGAEISTAADLARFGVSLFEGGLLNPASLAAMRSFQMIDVAGIRYQYGLGLFRFDVLGREHWAHSGGLFGSYGWFSYCPSTRVCMAVAYNYPVVKTGANLPNELLIALSTIADAAAGITASQRGDKGQSDPSFPLRIPFLDPTWTPDGP
jgi:D-alanyl-D-alanine carboxypeptidase